MKNFKFFLISFFFSVFCLKTLAYIPSYSFLLSQLAHFHGRGGYFIEQTVTLKLPQNKKVLKEKWWINSSGQLRLDVTGEEKLFFRFIYTKKDQKLFRKQDGSIKTQKISYYHLEKPFHLRKKQQLKKLFALWKVVPFNNTERKKGKGKDAFVKLVRKDGILQHEIGLNKNKIWMEQDEFVLRGWKWQTGETLIAKNYKLFPKSLFFPLTRHLKTPFLTVDIQVQKIHIWRENKSFFSKKKLTLKNNLPASFSEADKEAIVSFYQKYR